MNRLFGSKGILADRMRQANIALRDTRRANIVLATVNDPYAAPHECNLLRDETMWALAEQLFGKYTLYELNCATTKEESLPRHCRQLAQRPACLFVYNLEAVAEQDRDRYERLIDSLNRHREDIRETGTAFVLWLTPPTRDDVLRLAPDFADWRNASILFTIEQGIDIPSTVPYGISITEADDMRRRVQQLEAMLQHPDLEPSLAADFQQQLMGIRNVLGTNKKRTTSKVRSAASPTSPLIQRKVRKAYLNYLLEHCGTLNPRGISQTVKSVSLPLDEVYVSLMVERNITIEHPINLPQSTDLTILDITNWNQVIDYPLDISIKTIHRIVAPLHYLHQRNGRINRHERDTQREKYLEKVDLPYAITNIWRLVIIGDPGAGKTTLTKFLTTRFVLACLNASKIVTDNQGNDYGEPRLPILIRVAAYADALRKNRNLSLKEFLPVALADVPIARDDLHTLFHQTLIDGNAFILLDGMDEVADAGERIEIARKIDSFSIGIPPANRILVTSRIVGYSAAPLNANFQVYTLRDMGREQIERFLTRWCTAVERFHAPTASPSLLQHRADAEIRALLHAVDVSEGVRRLSGNPLLLTILALIHRNSARLPERRIELYELASKTLLRDWRLAQAGTEARIVEEYEALELLGPLAYWMHDNEPTGLIHERDAREQLCKFYAEGRGLKSGHPDVQAAIEDFLRRVREHSGLFVERAPGKYSFMHLTFEEYFAAREIVSDLFVAANCLRPHRHKARWEEVIRLAIAYERPKNAAHLIRSSIWHKDGQSAQTGYVPSEYEEILRRDLFLAARCLGDCASVEPTLAWEVAEELVTICLDSGDKVDSPGLIQQAAETLEAVRTSDVGSVALQILLSAVKNNQRSSISTLGRVGIGSKEALQALLEAVKDESNVRYSALYALGTAGVGSPQALQTLINLLKHRETSMQYAVVMAIETVGAGSLEAAQALLNTTRHVNGNLLDLVADTLEKICPDSYEMVQTLLSALKDTDLRVRCAAMKALGSIGSESEEAFQNLVSALRDEHPSVRSTAVSALAKLRTRSSEALQALMTLFQDTNSYVRCAAVSAIGTIGVGSAEALKALLGSVKDTDIQVRSAVLAALSTIGEGSKEALQTILAATKDAEIPIQCAALLALEKIGAGSPEALQALLTASIDGCINRRHVAVAVLKTIGVGSSEALQTLLTAVTDESSDVRSAAVDALSTVGVESPEALQALITAAKDENADVRRTAMSALRSLGSGSPEAIQALLTGIEDPDGNIRYAAWRSLSMLVQEQGN